MEYNIDNNISIEELNTHTEVKTDNTESVTTDMLLEASSVSIALLTLLILFIVKKLTTKYEILKKYGITEDNIKNILDYVNKFIKDIVESKVKKENIKVDFIEENIKKSTIKDTSDSLQNNLTNKINNITKVGNKLNNSGDEK